MALRFWLFRCGGVAPPVCAERRQPPLPRGGFLGVLEEVLAGGELDFADMVEGGKETGSGGEIVGFAGEGGILGQLCKGDVDLVELGMAEDDTVKALLPEPEGLSLMEAFGCGGKIAAGGLGAGGREDGLDGLGFGADGERGADAKGEEDGEQERGEEGMLHVASSRMER